VQVPPPPNRAALPILAAVTYEALLIAIWGFTSLLLDEDVISDPDAGILLGPAMAASAALVVFASLWGLRARRSPGLTVVATSTGVYGVMLLVALVGRALISGPPGAGLVFAAGYATSPFVILPAVAAGITVIAVWAATRERGPAGHPNS